MISKAELTEILKDIDLDNSIYFNSVDLNKTIQSNINMPNLDEVDLDPSNLLIAITSNSINEFSLNKSTTNSNCNNIFIASNSNDSIFKQGSVR